MKVLICTDGSEHSKKAIEKGALIAGGCNPEEVAVIHVYDEKVDFSTYPLLETGSVTRDTVTKEDLERFWKIQKEHEEQREKILAESANMLEVQGIKARKILKRGHPADTIVKVAQDEGFDMIVIGSRGLGGVKKMLLGSVSNAVIQEAKNCCVLTVK